MKKRLLSLFVIFSMMASIFVMPVSVSAANAADEIQNIQIEHKGNGQYTATYEFNSGYVSDTAKFQVFTKYWLDNIMSDPSEGYYATIENTVVGMGFASSTFTDADVDYGVTISELKQVKNITETTNLTFDFSLDPKVYNTLESNETTTYYLFVKTDKETEAYTTFTIKADGSVQQPQATLQLDSNGGTIGGENPISVDAKEYTADELIDAIASKIESLDKPANKKFIGWASSAMATAAEGLTIAEGETKIVYAVWQAKTSLQKGDFAFTTPATYSGEAQPINFTSKPESIADNKITIKYNGNTNAPIDKGTYPITISVVETDDYASITDLALDDYVINPAEYKYTGDIDKVVPIGTDTTVEQEITDVNVKDVKGNDVHGKFTATGAKTSIGEGESENVTWEFVPDTLDTNYKTFTKTGTITGLTRTAKNISLNIPSDVTYNKLPHGATVNIDGLTEGSDYEIQYSEKDKNAFSTTEPVNAGDYDVKVVLKGDAAGNYVLSGTYTGTLTIKQKEVAIEDLTLTKSYDKTKNVKINDNLIALSDLSLNSSDIESGDTVNLEEDTAFAAEYNSENVAQAVTVTFSGIKVDNTNYKIAETSKTKTASITAKEITATLKSAYTSKVFSKSLVLDATCFDYSDNFVAPDTKDELDGVQFESDATSSAAAVSSGYAITVKQQPTNTNYIVKLADNQKIAVTSCSTLMSATPKTGLKYKGEAYADADLFEVKVYANPDSASDVSGLTEIATGVNIGYSYTKDGQPATEVKNFGIYNAEITATVPDGYTAPSAAYTSVEIVKADYTYAGTIAKTVAIGTNTTVEQEITGIKVQGVNGDVEGKFTAIGTKTSIGEGESENVTWTFVPSVPDANYNTFTKSGTIAGRTRDPKTATLTIPEDVTYGEDYTVTATVEGLTEGTDFDVQYEIEGAYTSTKPTKAGVYNVKITLTAEAEGLYELTGTTTGTLKIEEKELTVTAPAITKVYDTTKAVTIEGEAIEISDLTLNGKVGEDNVTLAGTLAAEYYTPDKGTGKTITLTGLTLAGTAKDNYKLPSNITVTGDIAVKELKAVLKSDSGKTSKVYSKTISGLVLSDFNITDKGGNNDDTVTEAELAGIKFESDACEADANANADGYEIAITQPSSGNYNITTESRIIVTPMSVTIEAVPISIAPTYKGTSFGDNELTTVSVTDADGETVAPDLKYTYKKDGIAVAAVVDAGEYVLSVTLDDAVTNYVCTTPETANITIYQAQYKQPEKVEGIILIGQDIANYEINGEVVAVDGTTRVPGKFIITDTDRGTAQAGQVYENLKWKFVPTTDNANYTKLTGTNGKLTATEKTVKNASLSVEPQTVMVGKEYTVTAVVQDLTEDSDFEVQYKAKDAGEFTNTKPTEAGEYVVRIALFPTAQNFYELTGVTETEFKIIDGYKVTAAASTNGTFTYSIDGGADISGDTTGVMDGSNIKITATPDSGYNLNLITVTKADGSTVTVKNSEFEMPEEDVTIAVTFKKKSSSSGGGVATYTVKYDVGDKGKITSGKATESVTALGKPKAVPEVTANEGYKFVGWTQDGKTTVDPTTVSITKATTFTAVYEEAGTETPAPTLTPQGETAEHEHYVSGYEDGTFRAEDTITRAEVATIFALALADYDETKTYTSIYSDLDTNEWYANYVMCLSEIGAITGYEDGTFRAQQSITRQEFATMITRLGEVMEAGEIPFADVSEENWGIDYIYTAYANGWVTGYEDGTFRPENPITRAEAVRIVNGYLGRSVDETGLSNSDYKVFPDVEKSHWAYYEIIEAANDHVYETETKPEVWVD
ncbi:MAG: S-layer homology domain-containing protein [Hominilimicola sp.]